MLGVSLGLLVLRAANVDATVAFYSALGLVFVKEKHDNGPEHYACEIADTVLEIYPCADNSEVSGSLRLGFRVPSAGETLVALKEVACPVISDLADSPWGKRAVVRDPDGRKVELIEGN